MPVAVVESIFAVRAWTGVVCLYFSLKDASIDGESRVHMKSIRNGRVEAALLGLRGR